MTGRPPLVAGHRGGYRRGRRARSAARLLEIRLDEERRRVVELRAALDEAEQRVGVLQQSEAKFRGVVNQSLVGICTHQHERFTYTNAKFDEIFGYDAGELIGMSPRELVLAEDLPIVAEAMRRRQERESDTLDYVARFHRKDGRMIELDIHGSVMSVAGDQLLVTVVLDVTERKRLEAELRVAQKLESVGQLAAGVAHEINTPVQYVSTSVDFLRSAFAALDQLQQDYEQAVAASEMDQAARVELKARLSEAQDQADLDYLRERVPQALTRCVDGLGRVAKIVAAMRAFAHPSSDTPSLIDVNEEIRTTVSVAVNQYKYVADVSTTLGQVPLVVGAEGEIAQALLNLIVNAADAIAEVRAATAERGEIAIATKSDEHWVTITIADTGGGIPTEIADRVFDPFFTTKEVGRGTGQGLGIARSIVRRHHGTIGFEVRPGEGTTFKIQLPINVGRQDEIPREA